MRQTPSIEGQSAMNRKRRAGFSLIELVVVVAIIGILTSIAYGSYRNYVMRASRGAAQTELLQLANQQEKIYLNSNAYAFSITAAYNGRSDGGLGKTSGKSSDNKYTLSIAPTAGPTQTFTITATPVAGTTQATDGNLVIASDGTRTWGSKTW